MAPDLVHCAVEITALKDTTKNWRLLKLNGEDKFSSVYNVKLFFV